MVIDVAVPSNDNIGGKEHKKLGKYQRLKEELERAQRVKTKLSHL